MKKKLAFYYEAERNNDQVQQFGNHTCLLKSNSSLSHDRCRHRCLFRLQPSRQVWTSR